MKTLILTPNRNLQCGMYQLAKGLAKELGGEINFKEKLFGKWMNANYLKQFDRVITFMYPMHSIGQWLKYNNNTYWICYDQKIPPVTKTYFPNFWRRQAMRYINWRNNTTMQGADEYWNVTEREQKPRWTEKFKPQHHDAKAWCINKYQIVLGEDEFALYLGRTTDYKNYKKLKGICDKLKIHLIHPENELDNVIWALLSNARLYVTASIWEGYGRGVGEAQALGIYTICFDTGAHSRLVKYGEIIPNKRFDLMEEQIKEFWYNKRNETNKKPD